MHKLALINYDQHDFIPKPEIQVHLEKIENENKVYLIIK